MLVFLVFFALRVPLPFPIPLPLTNMSSPSVLFFDEDESYFFNAAEQRVRIYMADNVLHEILHNPKNDRIVLMHHDRHKEAYVEFKDSNICLIDILRFMGIEKAHVGIMWVDPSFPIASVDADAYIEIPVLELPLSQIVVIPYMD